VELGAGGREAESVHSTRLTIGAGSGAAVDVSTVGVCDAAGEVKCMVGACEWVGGWEGGIASGRD
jgi:hypothetical protein